jgi:SAM-dependent methyltransferase
MASEDVTHFTSVDQTADPAFFLKFLDEANKLPGAIGCKPAILDGLRLQSGAQILDIGCGVGDDAFDIADRVGPNGHVTGVDVSASLISEASRRAVGRNLPVSFEIGDAQALRFADNTFDAVRTERMLMHVPDPEKALSEMARVLRKGGRMAIHDFDWETQFCDSPYKDVTRKIALSFCDGIKNGWIGRCPPPPVCGNWTDWHLGFLSYDHRPLRVPPTFTGGHIARAVKTGVLSESEANLWWTHLSQANAQGTFLYGFTAFVVSGTKA